MLAGLCRTGQCRLGMAVPLLVALGLADAVNAAGTPAGTRIESTATVEFELGGSPTIVVSNTAVTVVDERIDVVATLQTPPVLVTPGATGQALLFTLTNTGNGTETFSLAVDNALGGDDFDPQPASPAIYFDTDASGDLTTGDQPYAAGSNDPVLAADASIDVLLVNDIPSTVANGDIAYSRLTATSATGTGAPGTVFPGAGDAGVDAVVGTTGGAAGEDGEYIVSDVQVSVVKTQAVSDTFGGTEPLPGATITYSMDVDVVGSGTVTASVLRDAIPDFTSFVPNSIALNGAPLTDAADADAGELDTVGTPTVVVRLGDLTAADGTQTITFAVTVD